MHLPVPWPTLSAHQGGHSNHSKPSSLLHHSEPICNQPGQASWLKDRQKQPSVMASATSVHGEEAPQKQPLISKLRSLLPGHQRRSQESVGQRNVAAAAGAFQAGTVQSKPTHLVVMANGLFGTPDNWSCITEKLRARVDSQVLLHASAVNTYTDTYDGIDVCGHRLAEEIAGVVKQHQSLQRISVIGHSMGGLLLRYAIGVSYNPATGKVAGLEPCHLITMATPHLGCDAEGVAQVPFIGWLGPLQPVINAIAVPTAAMLFRRTGRQFFLSDDDAWQRTGAAGLPLLARMTHDVPERGEYFWSAMCSFASRTAYANTSMDHLVGWANSSLRFMHQLPLLPKAPGKGVVREDELLAAFDVRFKPDTEPQAATSESDLPTSSLPRTSSGVGRNRSNSTGQAPRSCQPNSTPIALPGAQPLQGLGLPAAANSNTNPAGPSLLSSSPTAAPSRTALGSISGFSSMAAPSAAAPLAITGVSVGTDAGTYIGSGSGAATATTYKSGHLGGRAGLVESMLSRLQSLAWRRVDVCFKGSKLPMAHNHIQVTRPWLNFEGESVAVHVADTFVQLERAYQALQRENAALNQLERQSSYESPQHTHSSPAYPHASAQAVRSSISEQRTGTGLSASVIAPAASAPATVISSEGMAAAPSGSGTGVNAPEATRVA